MVNFNHQTTLQCSSYLVILIQSWIQDFLTNKTGRWRDCCCRKCSISADSLLLCFAILPLSSLVVLNTLNTVSHILNWHSNAKSLSNFCEEYFKWYPLCSYYARSIFLELRAAYFFDSVALLITCLIINGSTEWKLYTNRQFEANTKCI